ncbi:hypothetical protein H4582DRAFT_2128028 [Lactarius indigo]|nr:hypothetical protein H4582DRAFT_2128028 [Lactarius indigo]
MAEVVLINGLARQTLGAATRFPDTVDMTFRNSRRSAADLKWPEAVKSFGAGAITEPFINSIASPDIVAFLMLVDSANLVFVVYMTYHIGITNFGDYLSNAFKPLAWGQPAITLSAIVLEVPVQHFYAYRIYRLGGGSPFLPAAISVVSLTALGIGVVYSVEVMNHIHDPGIHFQGLSIAGLSCKVVCDVFITSGMVYYLLRNRTQVRRTNNVLNLLAIYSVNCGTLHLAFAISSVTLLAKYRNALIYTPSLFIMFRLSLCAFMAILNSRDNLRETLDGQDGVVVATLTQLKAHAGRGTVVPSSAQDTSEASIGTYTAVPKGLPPHSVYSDTTFSASVIAFDRERRAWITHGHHKQRVPDGPDYILLYTT